MWVIQRKGDRGLAIGCQWPPRDILHDRWGHRECGAGVPLSLRSIFRNSLQGINGGQAGRFGRVFDLPISSAFQWRTAKQPHPAGDNRRVQLQTTGLLIMPGLLRSGVGPVGTHPVSIKGSRRHPGQRIPGPGRVQGGKVRACVCGGVCTSWPVGSYLPVDQRPPAPEGPWQVVNCVPLFWRGQLPPRSLQMVFDILSRRVTPVSLRPDSMSQRQFW